MRVDPDGNSLAALIGWLSAKHPDLPLLLFPRTDEEFDRGLEGLFESAVSHIERNAGYLNALEEDAISSFVVAYLNMPGLRVTQETHTNGHVDITIEAESPLRRRLGEAKIYKGPAYHVKGLDQLVNRYTTGREGTGFVFAYVKQANIKDLVNKIRVHLDSTKPCHQQGVCANHSIKWAFVTQHEHSSGESFKVLHLNCNLHRMPLSQNDPGQPRRVVEP